MDEETKKIIESNIKQNEIISKNLDEKLTEVARLQYEISEIYRMKGEKLFFVKNTKGIAKKHLIQAAELGHAEACFQLGKIHLVRKKYKAFLCYEKAAEQGHAEACFQLGNMYMYDIDKETRKLIKKTDDEIIYEFESETFIKKDLKKAFKWYQKAIDLGSENARVELARIKQEEEIHKLWEYKGQIG